MDGIKRVFPAIPSSVAAARQFVRAVLDDWGLPSAETELIVRELVADALGDGDVSVELQRSGGGAHVEVTTGNE